METKIKDKLKENTYIANSIPKTDNENVKVKSEKVKKHVSYFLSEAKHEPLILEKENTGLLEAKWFSLDQIEDLTLYDDIKPIIAIGLEKINEIYENK